MKRAPGALRASEASSPRPRLSPTRSVRKRSGSVGRTSTGGVDGRHLAGRRSHASAELLGRDDLDVRAEREQLAMRRGEILEGNDGAAGFVDSRLAGQQPPRLLGHAHGHLDARQTALELARPLLPEPLELETRRPLDLVVENADRGDARDAVDTHARRPVRDEVPRAALQHEPERVDRAPDDAAALSVADASAPAAPHGRRELRQVRDAILRPEPPAAVEVEEP